MKVKVTEKQVMITEITEVNEGDYGINRCDFLLPRSFDELCVTAVFNGIPVPVTDGKCIIPSLSNGNCVFGVYAYRKNGEETEIMYSPKPTMFFVGKGSFVKEFKEELIPEVFDYETYCQMLQGYWRELFGENTLNEYMENVTEHQFYSAKAVNEIVDNIKTKIMGELDEIGDIVGGETEEATELVADLGDIEFAYSSGDGGYVGNFTLPDVPLEKNKRYAISVDGKEYKSTVAEVEGRLYLCNDAREDLGILAMCQDNNWSIVIFTSSDFSGTHNIKIYAGSNDKKAYQVVAYMATSNTGAYSFHTDEFDEGHYGLVIRDDSGTEYYNNPLRKLSADAVFGFKSCDKDYSDASLTQVYNAIAEGKTLSFIVTGDIDGVETTKTYTLGAPDFEWINPNNQRHYYGYGENYFAYVDYMLG